MKHRVFIAFNLPEEIKNKLSEYQKKWPELPVRWTKRENLHITLEFLGYVSEQKLEEVIKRIEDLAFNHKPFSIILSKICYGPPGKMPPRMIWAVGEKCPQFNFSPHITLGRVRTWEWRRIEPEERPVVNEEINLKFEVNSIEVMESHLKKRGAEYVVLKSVPLGK